MSRSSKVLAFEEALHDYAKANHGGTLDSINESGDYNDEVADSLKEFATSSLRKALIDSGLKALLQGKQEL